MRTYQNLAAIRDNDGKLKKFVFDAIDDHKDSAAYKTAAIAEKYYAKKNVTIMAFQKMLYNMHGQQVPDMWSANYKLRTHFFRRFVTQQVQYVLSNGITFEKEDTKSKLGADFDNKMQAAAKKALVDGVAYLFWNYDHIEVFGLADTAREPGFAPLVDETDGTLKAGIRHWVLNDTERYTLYEADGVTEYIKQEGAEMRILSDKRPYITTTRKAAVGEAERIGSNYSAFPIIPMYANDVQQSEMVGLREAIDCYDLVKSGFANTVDEAAELYWTIKNAGGMDDADLQQFIERMKIVRAANLPDGVEADAHTVNIPTEAREKLLALLERDLYKDAQIVNVEAISAGNKTATEIRAAYQPMDDKCGDFEYCIREYITKLFALIGIEDEPSFKWNRIANQTEETQMVMLAANYLDEETILNKLPWLTQEEVKAALENRSAEELNRVEDVVIDA